MKKGISFVLALALTLGLTTCFTGGDDTRSIDSPSPTVESPAAGTEAPSASETVTITFLNTDKEVVELEVPYDPQRVVILDMASLDILDVLGAAGSRVVGSADTSLNYLQNYAADENMTNLGTIETVGLEVVMVAQSDVISIGGRLARSYDVLSEIAPVVYPATDGELNVMEGVRQNTITIASISGLEDRVDELIAGFDVRIWTLVDSVADKTAIVGMCTSGGFSMLGNNGRCSIIGREIGFENIDMDADIDTSTHNNETSFKFVVEKNPGYVSVTDRDAAIQADGVQLAQEIAEDELVMGINAYRNSNIVYLAHLAVRYTAEGGITVLGIMFQGLEGKLPS